MKARCRILGIGWLNQFDIFGMMKEKDAVATLAALAQPMRLRCIRALVVAGAGGLTPGALVARLDVPAPTLSFHLKELLHAGLAVAERSGRNIVYRADFDRMGALLDFLSDNCCSGASCAVKPRRARCRD